VGAPARAHLCAGAAPRESEFLSGALAEAEQRLAALSTRAANTVERATVACLRVDLYTTLDQSNRAIAAGLDYLRHLGIDWSPHPTEEEARREYERIWSQLGNRTIDALIDLPLMSDPASLATLDVLTKIGPPAFYTDTNLLALVACRGGQSQPRERQLPCFVQRLYVSRHDRGPPIRRLSGCIALRSARQ
jgi:predicted ATPase